MTQAFNAIPAVQAAAGIAAEVPIGYRWDWLETDGFLTHRCEMIKMEQIVQISNVDQRHDRYSGAEMKYQPRYARIIFRKSLALNCGKVLDLWYPRVTEFTVSEEIAAQVTNMSTMNNSMDDATRYARIVNDVRNIAKVNDNRYFGLLGEMVRDNTAVFAFNLYKFHKYSTRHLEPGVDFINGQLPVGMCRMVIGYQNALFQSLQKPRSVLLLLIILPLIAASPALLSALGSVVRLLARLILMQIHRIPTRCWTELAGVLRAALRPLMN
jgi:hypothetical protein